MDTTFEYFEQLPTEIQSNILSNTTLEDIIELCRTSRMYKTVCSSEYDYLWRPLVYDIYEPVHPYINIEEFNSYNMTNFSSWFELYVYLKKLGINVETLLAEARLGHLDMVKYLLDNKVHSPATLTEAVYSGNIELVRYLVQKGFPTKVYPSNMENDEKLYREPLSAAASTGNIEIFDYLLKHGGDVTEDDSLAVEIAGHGRHLGIFKYLVDEDLLKLVDIGTISEIFLNTGDNYDIITTIMENYDVPVDMILEELRHSIEYGYVDLTKYIMDHYPDLATTQVINNYVYTTSNRYDSNSSVPALNYLIDLGIISQTILNNTFLNIFRRNNDNIEVAKLLIDKGADVHYHGEAALQWAIHYRNNEYVRFLISNGADIYGIDKDELVKILSGETNNED